MSSGGGDPFRWFFRMLVIWALLMIVGKGCEANDRLRIISVQLESIAGGQEGAAHPPIDPDSSPEE